MIDIEEIEALTLKAVKAIGSLTVQDITILSSEHGPRAEITFTAFSAGHSIEGSIRLWAKEFGFVKEKALE